jgi:hypothetical protein
MHDIAGMTYKAIGLRLFISTERVRQLYVTKKYKTPPVVKWLRQQEILGMEILARMIGRKR